MSVDELLRRDARIAELEVIRRHDRTTERQHELGRLIAARDQHWRKVEQQIANARRKARDLEHYARQAGIKFPERIAA